MPGDTRSPRISIVMPLYNKAETVLDSLRSVMVQTVTDWELIVIDDGSTDGGGEQVSTLGDTRLRLHRQLNAGVSVARNAGVELARADLVTFLDADDLWKPDFLAAILALREEYPQAGWFATGYEIRPDFGAARIPRLSGLASDFKRGFLPDYFCIASRSDPPVCSSVVAVIKKNLQAIGGFPAGITSGEDLLTWARLAARYPLAYDLHPLAVFRVSGIERCPDPYDRVGLALAELGAEYPQSPGLREYLGLWYRMRAVMALRFNDTVLARLNAWRACRHAPWQWRNGYTLVLALLPRRMRLRLDAWLRGLIS
jgi:glycosyltransferase involved in cell wall biosynthesis